MDNEQDMEQSADASKEIDFESPNRIHRHGHGGGKSIWCGSTSTGSGCQYSPTRRHER